MMTKWLACLAVLTVSGAVAYGRTPSFQGLGDLSGGDYFSRALGISGDGTVVIGKSLTNFGPGCFRWTLEEGMVGVDTDHTGEYFGSLYGADYNGEVLVGFRGPGYLHYKAFWWTEADDVNELQGPGATGHIAHDVSGDGTVIVGEFVRDQAFRWTQESGMVPLGDLPGGDAESEARAVSGDGQVVVGSGRSASGFEAFVWTAGTGMVGLGYLPGSSQSIAYGVSANGEVVVGSGGEGAFRWTEGTGMVSLGDLPGSPFNSYATDVSGDGSVVVGLGSAAGGYEGFQPFIWDEVHGMRDLQIMLTEDFGLDLGGWDLQTAEGISDDGSVIVGYGINPLGHDEAFVAILPAPAEVALDIKPGSWLNPLSPVSKGLLPVAVCGTDEFDVMTIDAETLLLGREGIDGVVALRWSYDDVATPFEGEPFDGHGLRGDGFMDLALKFSTQELMSALGLGGLAGQTVPLVLTGSLLDGTPLTGSDFVWVLTPGDGNFDGLADGLDYIAWSNHYRTGTGWSEGEFTGDGVVDGLDYVLWSNNYLAGSPGQVPEPGLLLLLGLGGAVLIRRRGHG